jgi:hypothetical protein
MPAGVRRSRGVQRFALPLNDTMEIRSLSVSSWRRYVTVSITRRIFSPPIEPELSKTNTRSTGGRALEAMVDAS